MFLACDTEWMPTQRAEVQAPVQLESQTTMKNSLEATHSVLFDTLTLVKEEGGAIKISYKLQPLKTLR